MDTQSPTPKKRRGLRITAWVIGLLLVFVLVGPLVIPIPPLSDTVPPEDLARDGSVFLNLNDGAVSLHVTDQGDGPAVVLLHGFTYNAATWRFIEEELSDSYRTLAVDRPGSGLTRVDETYAGAPNLYGNAGQSELIIEMLNELGIEQAVLVGNSAGGGIALLTALEYPDRVVGLVLVDAAIYTEGGAPPFIKPLFDTPQMDRIGPLLMRSFPLWRENFAELNFTSPDAIPDDFWEMYFLTTQADGWDNEFWGLMQASEPQGLPARLSEFASPVLVVSGEMDAVIPLEESLQLARDLPNAEVEVLPACGHAPQEECPDLLLEAMRPYLERVTAD